jgi:hypothetical protein
MFSDESCAAMAAELIAMAAANQVAVALKLDDQTLGGWVTSNERFGDVLEYVLLLDTEWGFSEKFPEGLTEAERFQRSSSKAAFELSPRLCAMEADGSLTQIDSYNAVIAWSSPAFQPSPAALPPRLKQAALLFVPRLLRSRDRGVSLRAGEGGGDGGRI